MHRALVIVLGVLQWFASLFVPKRFRARKSVRNETVLITGAGSGLGRLMAIRFAELGARRLVLWDLNSSGLKETGQAIQDVLGEGQTVHTYLCDVSDRQVVQQTAAAVKEEVGAVTILINNCGVLVGKLFKDLSEEEIERVMAVNTMSQFWTCKAFLPDMMAANHGHLVSIASTAGLLGVQKLTDYCASKFALLGFHEALRLELRSGGYNGIVTTVVCPYFVDTGLYQGLGKTVGMKVQTPEHVVNEIVEAVLTNQLFLTVPRAVNMLFFLKALLPASVFVKVTDHIRTGDMMKNFRGQRNVFSGNMLDQGSSTSGLKT